VITLISAYKLNIGYLYNSVILISIRLWVVFWSSILHISSRRRWRRGTFSGAQDGS